MAVSPLVEYWEEGLDYPKARCESSANEPPILVVSYYGVAGFGTQYLGSA